MRLSSKIIALCAALAVSPAMAADLTGKEIQEKLSGAILRGTTDTGQPYKTHYKPNGQVRGVSGFDEQYSDTGQWSIEGNLYCIQYKNWLNGERFCSKVAQNANVLAFTEIKSGITSYAVIMN